MKINFKEPIQNGLDHGSKAIGGLIGVGIGLLIFSPFLIPFIKYSTRYVVWIWNLLP